MSDYLDLFIELRAAEDFIIDRFDHTVVPTSTSLLRVPESEFGFVVSVPELAAKDGVAVLDAPHVLLPGTHDDLKVTLTNIDGVTHRGKAGDVIARLIFVRAGGRA